MRSIGIPVANREECVVALDVAFKLGKSLGSDILGYHMRPNRDEAARIDLASLMGGGGLGGARWPLQDEAATSEAAIGAGKLFEEMARQHSYLCAAKRGSPGKPHAVYRETVGSPDKLIPLFGPTNDLMVVSRPRKNGGVKAWVIMMSSLLDSPVPVLVLPQKKVDIDCKRIAIAWNRGRAENLLVHLCLPLLRQAEDVVFICAGRDPRHGPAEKDMIDYLKGHGIKARARRTTGADSGKALIQAAQAEKAGVLLSGAYTRGRLREMIFGGVTEYLVTDTDFPVILLHDRG